MGRHDPKPPAVLGYAPSAAGYHLGGFVIFGTFGLTSRADGMLFSPLLQALLVVCNGITAFFHFYSLLFFSTLFL
jgi:hypothetical protein